MDRSIVISVLLLVGLTWLLYKLAVLLEPRGDKSAAGPHADTHADLETSSVGNIRQKPIHQRLRK